MTEETRPRTKYEVSRRRFLRDSMLVSVGVVAAACAPSAAPQGGGTTGGGQAKKGGAFHGAWPYDLPPKGHYNYFASGAILAGGIYTDLFAPMLGIYRWADAKWDYLLAQSHSVSGNTFEVKLRPNIKWSDGTAFTSKDVATTYHIGRMEGFAIWTYIDRIDTPDDLTVRFNFTRPSSVAERLILRNLIRPDSTFGAIAQKARDLYASGGNATTPAGQALRKELADLRPATPPASGPYKIDPASVTEARLTMVRNPGGLFADQVNFDRIVVYQGETAQVTPLVLAGDVDYATHGFPLATDKAFVDAGIRVLRSPAYTGPAIYFHWEKAPQFQDKRLRQAVAHAINKEESARVTYGESAKAQRFMAGLSDNLVPNWISSADQGKFNAYEFSISKAEGLMRDAGYAKGSDGIYAKDGRKLEFELYFPSDFADWSSAATHMTDALNRFGIKITPRGAVNSQQLPDVNNGNFQIALRGWGIGNPHPQAAYIQNLRTHNTVPAGGGMKYPLKQTAASGAVDFDAMINEMGEGFDVDKQKAVVTRAALAFNELLPVIPLWERYGNNPVNTKARVAGWPPDNDPIYKNSFGADSFVTAMILAGRLGPI